MKLASLGNGTRDGRLVVVSRDLTRYTEASFLVRTLQAALDDWRRIAPHLEALAESLEHGSVPSERFHEHDALSPLPRAHGRLSIEAGAAPLHRASDRMSAPRETIAGGVGELMIRAGAAVVCDDVDSGAADEAATDAIRLLVLESSFWAQAGEGRIAELSTALSPVAVTPDEFDGDFAGSRIGSPLLCAVNGRPLTAAPVGATPGFGALIAEAARLRPLGAGTIVGAANEAGLLRPGDTIRVEMKDRSGHSIFGAIERTVSKADA